MLQVSDRPFGIRFFDSAAGKLLAKSLFAIFALYAATDTVKADPLVAFSLGRAEDCLKGHCNADLSQLSGITHLVGVVIDNTSHDVILVGERRRLASPLLTEDLVVALRAAFSPEGTAPLVSIDFSDDTAMTGLQRVRMEGGIEDTRFGRDLLAGDVVLKEIALGRRPTKVWGVQSYFDLARGVQLDPNSGVRVRFWFTPSAGNVVAVRTDLAFIQEDKLSIASSLVASTGGKYSPSGSGDPAADTFVSALNAEMDTLATAYGEVGRLRQLYTAVAAAEGLKALTTRDRVAFWLSDFAISRVPTDRTFPVLRRRVEDSSGKTTTVQEMEGGVDLKAFVIRLSDGDVTALRDLVLLSRPRATDAVSWEIPAQSWQMPGGARVVRGALQAQADFSDPADAPVSAPGVTLQRYTPPPPALPATPPSSQPTAPRQAQWTPLTPRAFLSTPSVAPMTAMISMPRIDRLGGIALSGHYEVSGAASSTAAKNTLVALITKTAGTEPSEKAYREMLTALWAVYFGDDRVGISLDPFKWGDKAGFGLGTHKVRYIGNVLNTDLARVMREADYKLKTWTIGSAQPKLRSFRAALNTFRQGVRKCQTNDPNPSGISFRFWFVPTTIHLVRTEDAILFDTGSMTLRSESSCTAALGFASFVTAHYSALASDDPLFVELFEYAKLVALARYVKDQHVPLYWFLMANKQLIITEQSPEVIGELTAHRTIDYQDGMTRYVGKETVTGGVDLWAPLDVSSAAAVKDTSLLSDTSIDRVRGPKAYSILNRDPLVRHTDYRGILYDTDLAIRDSKGAFLELVRYFNPHGRDTQIFGSGWSLLLPYRLHVPSHERPEVGESGILLEDLLGGRDFRLVPSRDPKCVGCLMLASGTNSVFLRLTKTGQSGYQMVDRMGDEFTFEPQGHLTEMTIGGRAKLNVEYTDRWSELSEDVPRYTATTSTRNEGAPSNIEVRGLSGEAVYSFALADAHTFEFRPTGAALNDGVRLLWRADNPVVIKNDYQYVFRTDGTLDRVIDDSGTGLIMGIGQGQLYVQLRYSLNPEFGPVVNRAQLFVVGEENPRQVVAYSYDEKGRLMDADVTVDGADNSTTRQKRKKGLQR